MLEKATLYFDDIYVGLEFPPLTFELTEEKVKNYMAAVGDPNPIYRDKVLPGDGGIGVNPAPPTMAALFILQSYKEYVESPPGGVHAGQYFKFIKPFYMGETLYVKARVTDKYIKKERKYVIIETLAKGAGEQTKVNSVMTIIWAG